ncbi:MAG: hypothetical protein JRJ46_14715 [Deltaproteobacteria bacterium]|nr:hypothetical protein [Deltaproteobacteria bacterium]
MKKIVFYVMIAFFLVPAGLQAGTTVTAEGLSFFEPGRELIAREKALDEAKRSAVEKAMGTTIESRTAVEDFQVVKDQIMSRSAGYLKDIKILEENKTDLGTYEIKIQAEVEIPDLVDDLDRFKKILKWQKNPRISVVVEPGLKADYLPTAKKTANQLIERLKHDGFKVFKYSKKNKHQMGLLVGLSLELSTRKTTYQDLDLTLNEISLSTNIYRPGDEEILATASAVKSMPGENKLCIDKIWNQLRKKLSRLWEKELYSQRDIYLIVKKIASHAEAEDIGLIFKSDVSGIVDAQLISFSKKKAEYSLKYRGWPEQLLNEIQMAYFKNKYFEPKLEAIEGNQITITK